MAEGSAAAQTVSLQAEGEATSPWDETDRALELSVASLRELAGEMLSGQLVAAALSVSVSISASITPLPGDGLPPRTLGSETCALGPAPWVLRAVPCRRRPS